jgi:hypothetical protein
MAIIRPSAVRRTAGPANDPRAPAPWRARSEVDRRRLCQLAGQTAHGAAESAAREASLGGIELLAARAIAF